MELFKYQLSSKEKFLEFKIEFVICVLMLIAVIFFIFGLFHIFNIFRITNFMCVLNFVYVFLALLGIKLLREDKKYYTLISYLVIVALEFIVTLDVVYVPMDVFSPIWYLPIIVGSYIALDAKKGIVVSGFSLILLCMLYFFGYLDRNLQSINTLFAAIMDISVIGYITVSRLEQYNSENLKIQSQLNELANIDYLTKIYNRRAFYKLAQKLLSFAQRKHIKVCVIMIDVDYFKKINDTYGHKEGDETLRNIVKIVSSSIREGDLFGRIGGEEFALLALNCDEDECFCVAEKIRQRVAENIQITKTTISAGVCCNNCKIYELDELLKIADKALYKAKEDGRNTTRWISC